jgi:protein-disulfide isomerase
LSLLRRIALALALLLLAGAPAAAATRDWSTVAVRTPAGGFVQGNPNAKVKLVEYLSMTCSHCAKLESEAIAPLTAKYIRTGLVSYEVRHALRDGFDFAASMVARCGGPGPFFARMPVLLAQQESWMDRARKWVQATPPKDDLPPEQLLPLLAQGSGVDTMFASQGLSPEKARACLGNMGEQKILTDQAEGAWSTLKIPGTPAFQINGALTPNITTWAELDQALAAALK